MVLYRVLFFYKASYLLSSARNGTLFFPPSCAFLEFLTALPSCEEQPSLDLTCCHIWGLRQEEYVLDDQQEQSAR